jgi:hypothetical protein
MSFRITIPEFNSNKLQNFPVSDTTPLENQVLQFSQNQWGPATLTPGSEGPSISPYIVGSGEGDYATITEAIAAAVADGASAANRKNIYLKPGTYTENLSLADGINLVGFNANAITLGVNDITNTNAVEIVGNITIDPLAVCSMSCLSLTISGFGIVSFGLSTLQIVNCLISSTGTFYHLSGPEKSTVYINSSQILCGPLSPLVNIIGGTLVLSIAFSKVYSTATSPCAGITLDVQGSFVKFSPVSDGAMNYVAINASNFISADDTTFMSFNNASAVNIVDVKNTTGISGVLTATTTSADQSSYTFSNCYGIPTFTLGAVAAVALDISNCYDTTRNQIINKFPSSNDSVFLKNFVYTGGAHLETANDDPSTLLSIEGVLETTFIIDGVICGTNADYTLITAARFSATCNTSVVTTLVGTPTITLYESSPASATIVIEVIGTSFNITVKSPDLPSYRWTCTYTIQYMANP